MPRPCYPRRVGFLPDVTYFKPAGVPLRCLQEVTLTLDELEALRLADLEGMYQEAAAEKMGVSRATFARIVAQARHKSAEALIAGRAIRMEGGKVVFSDDMAAPPPGFGRGFGRFRGRRGFGRIHPTSRPTGRIPPKPGGQK